MKKKKKKQKKKKEKKKRTPQLPENIRTTYSSPNKQKPPLDPFFSVPLAFSTLFSRYLNSAARAFARSWLRMAWSERVRRSRSGGVRRNLAQVKTVVVDPTLVGR